MLPQQVTVTLIAPDWQAAWRPDLNRLLLEPPLRQLIQRHQCNPPSLESDMLQDLRLVIEAIGRPQGFTDLVVRTSLKDYNPEWRKYKRWCLDEGLHPWLSFDHKQVSASMAQDQLMAFLDFVKPSMQAYLTSATTSQP